MEKYIIEIGGEIIDVPLSFFERLCIVRENLISSSYFISFRNGNSDMSFSISEKEYDRARQDIRDKKIDRVLGNENKEI